MSNFTPREIVSELDKYIIGQKNAKRSVAIALRNRWRRQQIPPDLRDEVAPKNIIMIGPTGVGKTEIARRLSNLAQSPFLKVEASKFTEVGYVGRDVESMVRDLTEIAINMVKQQEQEMVHTRAAEVTEERLLDLLLPPAPHRRESEDIIQGEPQDALREESSREKFRKMLRAGKMEDRYVELEVSKSAMPTVEIFTGSGMEEMGINLKEMMDSILPRQTKRRKLKISEAREIIIQEEVQKLIDMEKVTQMALEKVQQSGIIFLDEIDKIAGRESRLGPDVSREGVQRDLLPIVEGSTVNTKYGMVKTDHILFIASGAFNVSKPSDLIPELQGRFPIRVELDNLGEEDFVRILTEPKNALVLQYQALLKTEGVTLDFTTDAVAEIARIAVYVNESTENIGARRLHTVMENLLEEVSFKAPEMKGQKVKIDADYVREKLKEISESEDLSRYIL